MNNRSSLLSRSLCRRYAAAVFSSVSAPSWNESADPPRQMRWGLGTLIDGRAQILGAWPTTSTGDQTLAAVLRDLHRRGVEILRFSVGDFSGGELALKQAYRHGQLIESIEQSFESAIAAVPARDRMAISRALGASVDAVELSDAKIALARFQDSDLGERYTSVVKLWAETLSRCRPLFALHPELREQVRAADCKAAEVRGQLTRAMLRHGPFVSPAAWHQFVVAELERADRRLARKFAAAQVSRDAEPMSARPAIPAVRDGAGLTARA